MKNIKKKKVNIVVSVDGVKVTLRKKKKVSALLFYFLELGFYLVKDKSSCWMCLRCCAGHTIH